MPSISWNELRDYDGSGDAISDEVITIPGSFKVFPEFWPEDNSPSSVELWTSAGKTGTKYTEKPDIDDVDSSGDYHVNYKRGGLLTTHADSEGLSLFLSYNEIGTFDRVKYLNSIRNIVGSGDVDDADGNVNLVTHANDDAIHSGGEGNVTAAANIREGAVVIGDDGAKGIKDGDWSMDANKILHASGDLDMHDGKIDNIKEIEAHDGTLDIILPSEGTVNVKGTATEIVGQGFGDPAIDDYHSYLTAYWAMEETGANARIDSVGSNDAAATNTPGIRAGINKNACDFASASSQKLVAPNSADLQPTTGLAISGWFYLDNDDAHRGVIDKGDITNGAFSFYLDNGTNPVFRIYQTNGIGDTVEYGVGDYTGAWYHFVCIAADGYVRLYLNNVEDPGPGTYNNTIRSVADDVSIGSVLGYFDGGIDEVAFWKNITFAGQTERDAFVDALYNDGVGKFRDVTPPATSPADFIVQNDLYVGTDALVSGDSRVSGDSHVSGDLRVAQKGYFGDDAEIVGMSGDIFTSESVENSIEELDSALDERKTSGFVSWDSGTSGDVYTIAGNKFQIDRDFTVRIRGKEVNVLAGEQTGLLTAYKTNWIYAKDDGGIDAVSVRSDSLFEEYVPMFEALWDGSQFTVVRENHPYTYDVGASLETHDIIGTVLEGTGADITRVATGTGASVDDRKIKIVGADILHDHGLSVPVPDSAGAAVTLNQYYTDGSGRWIQEASQEEVVMKYNDSGTSTALGNGKYGVGRVYISKDDIENGYPKFYTVMGDDEYDNLNQALVAIGEGIPEATLELFELEVAQLGYYIVLNNASGGYIIRLIIEKATLKSSPTGAGATNQAALVAVDTTNFDNNLGTGDSTVQLALDTIDDLSVSGVSGDVIGPESAVQDNLVSFFDGSGRKLKDSGYGPDNIVKAWVNFNGQGVVAIQDSFNVASVTDVDQGRWTVQWDTDFANNDYALGLTIIEDTVSDLHHMINSLATSGTGNIVVTTTSGAAFYDPDNITVIAIGDQ